MSRNVLYTSVDTDALLNWVQVRIAAKLSDNEYRQAINHFKDELTTVRFRVAKPKTYPVELVKRGNKLSVEVLLDNRQVINYVDGIVIRRRFWLFGDFVINLDPDYEAHD